MTRSLQWMDDALCREIDGELFFPDERVVPHEARKACRLCTVQAECLEYALEHNVEGVWAGTTALQRREIKRGVAYRQRAS